MTKRMDPQAVLDFWFPPGLETAGIQAHARMFGWWFGGGANAALPPFEPLVKDALTGRLDGWAGTAWGRLSLIIVLDQFTRGLAGPVPAAYAGDARALELAEEGLRNGDFDVLAHPWERTFLLMPLVHAEGADHVARMERMLALCAIIRQDAPAHLRPLYEGSDERVREYLDVIRRYGHFPHRNAILGRDSTPAERDYLARGDFPHLRPPPAVAALLQVA
ncbi:DUF924 family protein [Muricoccus radiodurans]|uniref:DUF924 family protein n=1 Tax=Muricoccus radiodurans TaxID=2231721 RepID=UPI003CF2ACE5